MNLLAALTLKQLRTLQTVAETRSLTQAADLLRLTPPAVHSQIKQLEGNFGCALLSREGAEGFRPTPEGAVLLEAQRRVRSALEHAIYEIESIRKGLAGTVVLGVVSTGKYFAPRIVALLRKALPEVEVILRIGNRSETIVALEAGDLDLVIMGRPPRAPAVEAEVLGEHPHLLIAPPDHPLIGRMATAAEILAEPFILREPGSGTRILATRYLDELGAGQVVRQIEMDSNETIKQAVLAGLGIAILSGHTVHEELRTGRLAAIRAEGLPIVRQWFVLHRSDRPPSSTARSVRDWILVHAREVLPAVPEP
jgi:DNA-binding transcriptional LysR family regulator